MTKVFRILIGLILLPLILGFLGRFNWFFDVFSHFRLYYLIALILGCFAALFFKKWIEAGISGVIALLLIFSILKFYQPVERTDELSTLKIISINLLSSNSEYQTVIDFVMEEEPDVVIFQELSPKWFTELDALKEMYPIQKMIPRMDNFGIGMMSRIPLDRIEEFDFSTVGVPSLLISTLFEGEELSILATHPLPPIWGRYFKARNDQFDSLSSFIETFDNEILLIGDLNSTNFSPNFSRLMKNGKLRDSRLGFGLLPTWHAGNPLISVTLDHALVTDGLIVSDRRTGPYIGSDHLPVVVEVSPKKY